MTPNPDTDSTRAEDVAAFFADPNVVEFLNCDVADQAASCETEEEVYDLFRSTDWMQAEFARQYGYEP